MILNLSSRCRKDILRLIVLLSASIFEKDPDTLRQSASNPPTVSHRWREYSHALHVEVMPAGSKLYLVGWSSPRQDSHGEWEDVSRRIDRLSFLYLQESFLIRRQLMTDHPNPVPKAEDQIRFFSN